MRFSKRVRPRSNIHLALGLVLVASISACSSAPRSSRESRETFDESDGIPRRELHATLVGEIARRWNPSRINEVTIQSARVKAPGLIRARYVLSFDQLHGKTLATYRQISEADFRSIQGGWLIEEHAPIETKVALTP